MRLTLENFRYHRKWQRELPDTGVVLFTAPSGAGKSTVLAAFEFLLYGKLRNVASFDTKNTSVTLEYTGIALRQLANEEGVAPELITILRKRGPALFRVSYDDKVYEGEEAQGIVNRMFGATPDVFLASSYLKQGERSLLLDGKNSDKMELIEKLTFNDDDIASRKETISTALRDTDRVLSSTRGVLKTLENQISSFRVLHERPLALLRRERERRQPPPTITTETLETEYQSVERQREECWHRKTEYEVQERTRVAALASNANIEQQIAKLSASVKSNGMESPSELELQILNTIQVRVVANQWEEYLTVRKQDQGRLADFKRRHPQYGTLKVTSITVPSATEQHQISSELALLEQADSEYRRFRAQNERTQQELREVATRFQEALNTKQAPSTEEVEAYLEKAAEELALAKKWQVYLTARAEDQRRLADFKQRYPQYGTIKIDGKNTIAATEQGALNAELETLIDAGSRYRSYQDQEQKLRAKLDSYPPDLPTLEELGQELEVIKWQEDYAKVADVQEPTLTPGKYPDDLETVYQMISELEERRRQLTNLTTRLQDLGVSDGEELQQRLNETRARLETCGTRVACPQCREDLIFSQGTLRCTQSLRKSKPLPPRIGAGRSLNAPSSPVPATPASPPLVLCNDPPSLLEAQIREYEQVLTLMVPSPANSLAACEAELNALQEWRQKLTNTLAQKEMLRAKLDERQRLEGLLQGRSTKRTTREVMELQARNVEKQRDQEALEALQPVAPVDEERLKEVRRLLALITEQQTAALFKHQDEEEQKALKERLILLQVLYPEATLERLGELDALGPRDPTRGVTALESTLAITRAFLQRQQQLLLLLRDVTPVDERRIVELRAQLAAIDRQRQEQQLVSLFAQQEELERQAREKRLQLLQRLHPSLATSELESLDTGKVVSPVESVATLDAKLDGLRRQLATAIKTHEVRERIRDLRTTIQTIPPSMAKELAQVVQEIAKHKERGEVLQELKRCLTLELELQNLQSRLQEQQLSDQAETKKYAILDKLRLKLLEAETITLESTVASINLELANQLENLFDTPISVRFETMKQQANGQFKHCVNLAVHYRGQVYDDISQLSGGETARVSLAITLALNKTVGSPLLLLDESLSALDGDLVDTVIDTLKVVSSSSHIPIFVVLHNSVQGHFDEVVEFE